jgi:leucyl-tRNA synthetase
MKKYDHKKIEKKWREEWAKSGIYRTEENTKKPKSYVLDMFPYPSGEGLHVGHPKGYIATDVYSRMKKMQGHEILHPMGWDAFGLPAENFALKNKTHPRVAVKKNIARFKEQLSVLGFNYDWSREINTTDPEYYKWTQWIFLQLFKKGLAYESDEPINWCPSCKTGLANEDLEGNACERCGTPVEQKKMRQWVLRITDYAERLLEDLEELTKWPAHIREMQKNWIGKSEGAMISFQLSAPSVQETIDVFTTRPDTLFGATYMVLAPEHPLIENMRDTIENYDEIVRYIVLSQSKTEIERTSEDREKTGVELKGVKALNPATKEEIPVFIADYVLAHYGTGAIMAVPAHDERDWDFAKKYNLPIREVVVEQVGERHKDGVYRRVTVTVIENEKGEVLMQSKEVDGKTYYCLPGGGVDEGETIEEGALRETREETGYNHFSSVREIGTVEANYFNPVRKIYRRALSTGYAVKIADETPGKPALTELEAQFGMAHTWISKEKALELLRSDSNCSGEDAYLLTRYLLGHHVGGDNEAPYTGEGVLIYSGEFTDMLSREAKAAITKHAGGEMKTTYKLRDWVFSRQRYWGEPIPIIHCEKCGPVAVPEKDLPVELPEVESYEPTGTGESPLAGIKKWVEVNCPKCDEDSKKTKHLIFDFDGVLGDTYKASLEARVRMGDAKNLAEAKRNLDAYFSAKPSHARGDHFTQERYEEYHDWSLRYATAKAGLKYPLFDGFVKEIKKLENAKIAIVSAGYDIYSKEPLEKSGLKYTHFLAGNHDHSKESKIEKICAEWNVDVKDIYYFTDTQADVYELEHLLDRTKIIGCAWGYQGEKKLREVLPREQILKKFVDVHNLWKPRKGRRETNTMPQWAGSSWYYLRFMDPHNDSELVAKENEKYWAPVDMYVGGAEHATRHLIYARFWHKFLFDLGVVSTKEPFAALHSVGLIQAEDGRKMSKRFGNVINPDDIVQTHGADTLRVYEMFMGPFEQAISWNADNLMGARRFLERTWRLCFKEPVTEPDQTVERLLHRTIKKVTDDILVFKFNTAIATIMTFVNSAEKNGLTKEQREQFVLILAPFVPHISEEIWHELAHEDSVHLKQWPSYDPAKIVADEVKIAVQVNGKVRALLTAPQGAGQNEISEAALNDPMVQKWLSGREPKKVVFVPDRLISFVV